MAELNIATEPTWSFLYLNVDKYEDDWERGESKEFAGTLEDACSQMVRWIQEQPFEVSVDYEALALHVPDNHPVHKERFPNLLDLEHEIVEYI